MLSVSNLHLAFGELDLLFIDSWTIQANQKYALVGANGTGKSSLIRVLLKTDLPMDGTVHLRNGSTIGYLPQQAVSGSSLSLWEEVRSGMQDILTLERQLEEAQAKLQSGSAEEQSHYFQIEEKYRQAGGYNQEERIGSTLHGLGFDPSEWHKSCALFSGGWQMRIALAKLLLSNPDLAILDEPTNHLDYQAKAWLSKHLSEVDYALLIVSHEGSFLDPICSHVAEIRNKKFYTYSGSYSQFLTQREEQIKQTQAAYERQQMQIQHLQSYIDRFGAKATKAKQAQSRKKQLEKIERIEAPDSISERASLHFHEAPASDFLLYQLEKANIGWTTEDPLLVDINLRVERGMRMVVVGANGCGKSTLLKTILGTIPLQKGRRIVGNRIRPGLYSQDLAQQLPLDETPIAYIHSLCPMRKEVEIRRTLGSLGLKSLSHGREIQFLSGGEKARVVLAELALAGYNALFLDEPTNHLDTASAKALADAMTEFPGSIFYISHDKTLIERTATHVLAINDQSIELYEGYDPKYLEFTLSNSERKKKEVSAKSYREQQKERNQQQKLRREYSLIEESIGELESRLEETEAAMFQVGSDAGKLAELSATQQSIEAELEAAMERWEELEEQIAGFED